MASWQKLESSLPQSRAFGSSAIFGNFLYVCGGADEVTAPFSTYRNQILRARIAPDGSLGQWKVAAVLADDRLSPSLLISDTGVMYVVGGVTDADPAAVAMGHEILSGRLNAEGDLIGAGLQVASRMPASVSSAGVVVNRDNLYVVAGSKDRISLDYTAGTGNFQVGEVVTGVTSGASGTVHSIISDGGASGSLGVESVSGTFLDNELLHGDLGGRAVANGGSGDIFLDYAGAGFLLTQSVIGVTSLAEAVVAADDGVDTLTVTGVSGVFEDGEGLKQLRGAAAANGTLYQILGFDFQRDNFAVAQVVKGFVSGVSGTVFAATDGGTDGTLSFRMSTIAGGTDFQGAEWIHGNENSRAVVSGAPVMELDYDAQTGDWTVGEVVTGGTSGATAVVVSDTDNGTDGTLVISTLTGTFADNEALTGSITGAAVANGTNRQTINYITQTIGAFVVGQQIYGGTNECHAEVVTDTPGAPGEGVLVVKNIEGDFTLSFAAAEVLVGFTGGAAVVSATLTNPMLDFDAGTADFDDSGSATVVGGTGGAEGTISVVTLGAPGEGTLTLTGVTGTFTDGESLQGYSAQLATADGTTYTDLDFDGQTAAFAVDEVVTGLTSGATLRIAADDGSNLLADFGAGTFSDLETIAGSLLGSAAADGDSVLAAATSLTILRAKVDSDGGVGAWQSFGTLPSDVSSSGSSAVVVVNDTMYVSGGGTLYWAKIGIDALDRWNQMSMPDDVSGMAMLGIGDRLVVLGGVVAATDVGTVRCLQLGGDGAPTGNWYRTADMSLALSSFGAAAKDDRIYVVGGKKTAVSSADVLTARLLDGLIGGEKI